MDDSMELSQVGDKRAKIQFFLSYCPEDVETAERIAGILARLDYEVWYAEESVLDGEDVFEATYKAITNHNLAIILVSNNYVQSGRARHEMNTLMDMSLGLQTMRVVPILISEECEIPALLRPLKNIDMRSDFEGGLIKLLKFLRRHSGRA